MKKNRLLLRFAALVTAMMCALGASAAEAYACYTPENTTLTFYYDNQRSSRSGTTYDLNTGASRPNWYSDGNNWRVTKVVFDPSFANARPTTTYDWFYSMKNLQSITGISYLNTSEVTRMSYMFYDCSQLTSLDLSHFDTSQVTNMRSMFYGCTGLTNLDLSSFNTSNVISMQMMFCTSYNLQTIYVGDDWSTAAVTASPSMFDGCTSLVGGKGTTYDANYVDKAYAHIDGGPSNPGYFTDIHDIIGTIFEVDGIYYKVDINEVLVSNDGTGQYGCYSGTVEIPELVYNDNDGWWYTVGGIDERAFYRCPYLKHLILPNSIGIIHNEAFVDAFMDASNSTITCMALTPPLISPNAPDSYNAPEMTLYVPYNTRSAYQAINAWNQFGNIVELPYSFKKDGFYYKITGDGKVSVTYKDGSYNTYSGRIVIPETVTCYGVTYTVTAIDNLAFFNCPNLTDVVIPETVTTIGNTSFKNCTSLTSITIPNSVTSLGLYAFQNCTSLADVVIGSGMTSIGAMAFNGCEDLDRGTITCLAQVPPTIAQRNTFDGGHYDYTVLYVPKGSSADYQQAQYWSNFYDIREIWTLDDALNDDGGTIHFESTSSYPWKVISDGGGALHYAESGNAGVPNTTSTLTATVVVPEGGATLSFMFQAWGEGYEEERIYDRCAFFIDGRARFEYGEYQNDWEEYSVDLEAGTHTLRWSYSKDGSVNPEGDYFAIDNVRFTSYAPVAYACYTPSNTTLTFYYDNQRSSRPGTTYSLNTGSDDTGWDTDGTRSYVTQVVFDPSFANARPTTTCDWFYGMTNLQSITGIEYLNTSEVTDMKYMFLNCVELTSLDVSHFNTSKVTDMYAMFAGCHELTSLDLSSFNTSMVSNMVFMFHRCTNLRTIYVGNGWSTAAVTSSSDMFESSINLVGGQGTTYDANHVDKTYAHIDGGPSNPGYFTDKNAGLRGDVDADGNVGIADVTALIDYLLTGNTAGVNPVAADVDGDSNVGIADVTALIDFILTGNWEDNS